MREAHNGLKSIIRVPAVYNLVQLVAGARLYRTRMVQDYVRPFEGCRILDIGCGTGEYVEFLDRHCSNYEYFGFDGEARYVLYGQQLFSNRPNIHIYHRVLTEDVIQELKDFDIVLAIGIMHHLDDPLVLSLLRLRERH